MFCNYLDKYYYSLFTEFTSSLRVERGFRGGSVVKNLPANAQNAGSIPGVGQSLGEGNDNPFQYSYLENPMDRGAWGHKTVRHDFSN